MVTPARRLSYRRRLTTLLSLAGVVCALGTIAGYADPVAAQTSAPTDVSQGSNSMDSVRRDVARMDSVAHEAQRIKCTDCGMLLLPAAAVLLIAPPVMFLPWQDTSVSATISDLAATPDFRRSHVTIYLTGGPAFPDSADLGWAHSENAEVMWRGLYAELRLERFGLPHHLQYRTTRAGYLIHPRPAFASGFTIGYRESHDLPDESGISISLPAMLAGSRGWGRMEPEYVFSRAGLRWNYRLQVEWPLPGRWQLFSGGNIEAKKLPLHRRSRVGWTTGAVLIGIRL